jgi:predicted porin
MTKTWIAALAAVALSATAAIAADKGGSSGVADLEERVAELEATVAKKGNRKVSLTMYGEINAAIVWTDIDGAKDPTIINNTASTSKFGFRGAGKAGGFGGGYELEFGLAGTEFGSDLQLRLANLWVETPVGKIALGRARQATDGITEITLANTDMAARMLNLKPTSTYLGVDDLPFAGTRRDVVRYETPLIAGFTASASYAKDDWDVALRYAIDANDIRFAAGIGYRQTEVDFWWTTETQKTLSGSASIMHVPTGLFLSGAYGRVDGWTDTYGADPKAWHVQAGIERKWLELGRTTLFGEYAQLKAYGDDATMIGAGVVQSIDAAALDLYLTGRRFDVDGNATVVTSGLRLKF